MFLNVNCHEVHYDYHSVHAHVPCREGRGLISFPDLTLSYAGHGRCRYEISREWHKRSICTLFFFSFIVITTVCNDSIVIKKFGRARYSILGSQFFISLTQNVMCIKQ